MSMVQHGFRGLLPAINCLRHTSREGFQLTPHRRTVKFQVGRTFSNQMFVYTNSLIFPLSRNREKGEILGFRRQKKRPNLCESI